MVAGLMEPCGRDPAVLAGGTNAWIQAGCPVVVSQRSCWSLERQVRLAAGVLLLSALLLALLVDLRWLALVGVIGPGLTFAGLSGFCPMAVLLGKMPWNRKSRCDFYSSFRQEGKVQNQCPGSQTTKPLN